MKFNEIATQFDAMNDGRKTALARTLREYGQIFGDASEDAIATGFRLAGRIQGDGPIAARAATCREIAELLDASHEGSSDCEGARAAWQRLIDGFCSARDAAPEDARGRYAAIVTTLQRELATF